MKKRNKKIILPLTILGTLIIISFILSPSSQEIIHQGVSISGNIISPQNNDELQYYNNLRFKEPTISYEINETCSQAQVTNTLQAFAILQNQTSLRFQNSPKAEIKIQCDNKEVRIFGKQIKGEGGPGQIFTTLNYNIILDSKINLFQKEVCDTPNLALHETLHALGFSHSDDKTSILYPESDCTQFLRQETIDKLNELYKTPPFADLTIQNLTIEKSGSRYNINAQVINLGLESSEEATLSLISNNRQIAEYKIGEFPAGTGKTVTINKLPSQQNNQLTLKIETQSEEISKDNNEEVLELN